MASGSGSSSRSSTPGERQYEEFRLHLLGGASLEGPAGTVSGRAVQRRRMALLALLAVARQRGMSRDKLVFYLWPDNEPERARHLLSDSLYTLNKTLGAESILSIGDQLRLNDGVVHSDVAAFEDAVEQRDWEAAVELYPGAFLEGTYLCSNPEWERWLDHERDRYAQAFGKALEAAARERGAHGDLTGAVELWRRAAVNDPTDSRIAISVMLALETAGNRTAAIQHAKIHEAMVREELDVPVPPEVHAVVERLRSATQAPTPPAPVPAESAPPPVVDAQPAVPQPEPVQHLPPAAPNPAARSRRWSAALLLIPVLLLVLGGIWLAGRTRPASQPATGSLVAIFPFSVRVPDRLAYLSDGMVDMLSANLDGVGDLRTVDPHAVLGLLREQDTEVLDPERARALARRLGADRYVLGSILEAGGRLQLNASLYDQQGRVEARAEVEVQNEAMLFELVDRLTVQLVAGRHQGPSGELARLAALTTSSLSALKAYLQGERAMRQMRYNAATEAFQRALAIDGTFALAAYRLSIGADWLGDIDLARDAVQRAARFSPRLPETDRLLVDALLAYNRRDPEVAEKLYRAVLARRPRDVEAWYRLGEVQFYLNPLRGRPFTESQEAFEQVLALEPDHAASRAHLADIALWRGDRRIVDTLLGPLLAGAPQDSVEWLLKYAVAFGDSAAQDSLAQRAAAHGELLRDLSAYATKNTQNFPGAQRLVHRLTGKTYDEEIRVAAHLLLAYLELAQGRPSGARRELTSAGQLNPAAALQYRALFATLPFSSTSLTEVRSIRDSLAAWNRPTASVPKFGLYTGMRPPISAYLLGLLSAQLRDWDAVRQQVSALERLNTDTVYPQLAATLANALRARAAAIRGDTAAALAWTDSTLFRRDSTVKLPSSDAAGHQRHLRPHLLRSLGRHQEALEWYGAGPWRPPRSEETYLDFVHLAPFHFAQGEILEQMGRGREAAQHYARFVELWKDAEPELQPQVMEARRRLARVRHPQTADGGNVGVEGGWVPRGKVPSRSERAGEMLGRAAGENECCGMGSSFLQ